GQADARDGWRQHERQLDERAREGAASKAPPADQVRRRRPDQQDQRHRDHVRLQRDDERVGDHGVTELPDQLAGRDPQEDRQQREQQEQRRDTRGQEEPEAEQPPAESCLYFLTVPWGGPNPAAFIILCPRLDMTWAMNAVAAALFDELVRTAISYFTCG